MITNNDIKKLKAVFATRDDLQQVRKEMATKEDLKHFATKGDLKSYATKGDLQTAIDSLVQVMGEMFEAQNELLNRRFDEIHLDLRSHQSQLDNHEGRLINLETPKKPN